jgi:nucleoid DNA-binding protein
MEFSNSDLFEAFYLQNEDRLKDLDLEDVKEIIQGPWKHLVKSMESEELPSVRLKYFGTFKVPISRAKDQMKRNVKRLESGAISQEDFNKYQEVLQNYINEERSDS